MFIVKNISVEDIELRDLHVVLGKGDQIDLDTITSRFHTEQSRSLKAAFSKGVLKVLIKDDHRGDYQIKTEDAPPVIVVPVHHANQNRDVIEAVKGLEEKLAKRLEDKIAATPQPQIDLTALNQALAALQSIANQAAVANPKIEQEIESPAVVDIHKRTLDRLAKSAESNVKHTEEKSDNTNVKKNIDELEGLL